MIPDNPPTSQAVTPTDDLEKMMDEISDSACELGKHGLDVEMKRSKRYSVARAALREYVSKDTRRLDWLESHEMTADYDGACRHPWSIYYEQANAAWTEMRGEGNTLREAIDAARRASMKEPE